MSRRFFAVLLVACSACGTRTLNIGVFPGDVTDGSTSDTISDAASDEGTNVPGPSKTIVASFFRIGFTTRDGTDSKDAWKDYGFDLDGICTTTSDSATSKNTCMRVSGSKGDVLTDGNHCIDNNFGSQLVPLVKQIDGAAETNLANGIKTGSVTLALRIDDLGPSGADASAPGALFAAKASSGKAKLDGSDVFDVDAISVDGDVSKPKAILNGSVAIVDGARVWTGRADLLDLPAVFIAGASGTIPIHDARIDVDLDKMQGTVGGFALLTDVQTIVGTLAGKQGICPGSPLFDSVNNVVAQSADMPQALPHDTTKTCVSLSIGLGLDLVGASLGKTYPTPAPAPDPCAKGG